MSMPTSSKYRNSMAGTKQNEAKLKQQYKMPQRTMTERTGIHPWQRNLDVTLYNIDNISNQIGGLLQVVKQPKHRIEGSCRPERQRGFEEYRKRIIDLEKLQEVRENMEEKAICENLKKHTERVYTAVTIASNDPYLRVKTGSQLQDITPISRPSVPVVPSRSPAPSRDRPPVIISRPSSKYIHFNPSIPKTRREAGTRAIQKKKQKYFHSIKEKNDVRECIIEEESNFSSKERLNQPEQSKIKDQPAPVPQTPKKEQAKESQDQREEFTIQTDLSMKKNFTFNENEGHMDTPVDGLSAPAKQEQTIYRPAFELKIYPCDLNKDTVKSFIADRLASVVKVDSQLTELKKIFISNPFQSNFTVARKKSILLNALWNRGMMIDENDLDYVINFDAGLENVPQQGANGKTLAEFVEIFVDKYLQAEYEWEKKVLQMLTVNQLSNTFFQPVHLDLQHKGHLALEDLACFINLHASGSPCFKNKQVQELFFRFCRYEPNPSRLSYQGFLSIISRPY